MPIQRTKLLNRTVNVRDAHLYVVATEGEKTEAQYLEAFHNSRVRVVTLPTDTDGKSAPTHVSERLDVFRSGYDLEPGDELWLMFDVDHHRAEQLSAVCLEAVQKGINLAVSNPCFELWLCLHVAGVTEIPTNAKECKVFEKRLREILGSYNKARIEPERFAPHIRAAIDRAKALDVVPDERWPGFPGTHVYRLVERLLSP